MNKRACGSFIDKERDKQYAALRDAIKAYAKFPIPETAQHAELLLRVIKCQRP